jgi:hypothetical protein
MHQEQTWLCERRARYGGGSRTEAFVAWIGHARGVRKSDTKRDESVRSKANSIRASYVSIAGSRLSFPGM